MPANGLILYTPKALEQAFVVDLTKLVGDGQSIETWEDGFLSFTFSLVADPSRPETTTFIVNAFNEWLAYHLEEKQEGEVVWDGLICQMDLTIGRTTRRRSLVDTQRPFANAVRAQYDNSGTTTNTSWATIDESIARFGRIEATLTETAPSTQTIAEQYRDAELARRGWPVPYTISISKSQQIARLDVMACGYIVTADWQEATVTIATTDNLSDAISDHITIDCPLLSVGRITSNTDSVAEEDLVGATPGQRVRHLVKLSDSSGNLYRAYVGAGGKFYYEKITDLSPDYFLVENGIKRQLGGKLLKPHEVRPGIMRDATFPIVVAEPGSKFASSQDSLITEVKRRQGDEHPDLRNSTSTDSDLFASR